MADVSVDLELNAKQAKNELASFDSSLKNFGNSVKGALSGLGAGFAAAFSFNAIKDVIASTVHYGSTIQDLSEKYHVSTGFLQRYGTAAEKAGASQESLAKALKFIEVNMDKALGGDTGAIKKFSEIGIDIEQLRASNPEQIFLAIAKSGADAAQSVGLAGKNALELRGLFDAISGGTAQLGREISPENIKRLDEMEDLFIALKDAARQFAATVIGEVIPAVGRIQDVAFSNFSKLERLFGASSKIPQGEAAAPEDTALAAQIHDMRERQAGKELPTELGTEEAPKEKRRLGFFDLDEEAQKESAAAELDVIGEDTKSKVDRANEDREARDADAKDEEDARSKSIKDEAQAQKDAVNRGIEDRRRERVESKERLNPAGISLHDFATQGSGRVAALAQQAEREEKIARDRGLVGDTRASAQHQQRAEELKKALGLDNKIDRADAFKDGLDKSEVLREIRDNTADATANK